MTNWMQSALLAGVIGLVAGSVSAQQPATAAKPRVLAPGVVTVIPAAPQEEEMFSGPRPLIEVPANIPKLNEIKPNYEALTKTLNEQAKSAVLRRTIWNLEFAFKPMRMIMVDVPQPSGKMQKKLIWYMVYRVKNKGQHWKPADKDDDFGHKIPVVEKVDQPLRFFPHFLLRANEFDKEYLDRVIPAAFEPIKARELPDKPLFDSLTISGVEVPVSDERNDRSVWGVVTWEDVDPRIDYFSVFVQGLTNAYRYEDPDGAYKAGAAPGTGRKFTQKTLQLNFWRPGDAVNETEEEIRYGVRIEADPAEQKKIFQQFGIDRRLDSLWIYR